ncbi:MAG: preprotein translocase subunit YajC [Elusimicrobia bacterium GWC2_51_8]|nr:MAG: preprotein translocase subunit YajC [Elusimicrobia bacterium GWA2_51_34]OGR58721.1 MAG: preprotein translocase subunit YajC [Elusimicrobia bacterium GWC2_51_8]OGR88158.1 MAG: preprotein translocase subunit YajC [Elusimicrobia bacterium GWF2_52_66]HAF95361.1 preprotein translocase subunit YajC [Elusimicrobiota bacterium]HCE98775.1 preprotein translocase subunit YajC [Elusimicrobiota bacterium]
MNQNSAFMQFIPLAAIMLIFYFLLIRPQQKQLKERKKMLEAIKTGDKILTNGGIIGTISAIREEELELEIAKGVKITLVRSAVASVLNQIK